jgi:putative LysE/RhtB family amino acid efflux pump
MLFGFTIAAPVGPTITNPMTILSFAAAFAGLGLHVGGTNYAAASSIVAGVFAGSAAWWLILCSFS